MKKEQRLLYLVLLLLLSFPVTYGHAQNLIANPGFETTAAPWVLDNWAGNVASASRITTNPHSGNYCAQVQLTTVINSPSLFYVYPGLAIKPNMAIEIRFWARGVSNGSALTTMIRKGGSPFTTYFRTETGLTDDWQEFVYTAVMPSTLDSTDVTLRFMINAVGYFCIDDVSIVQLPSVQGGSVPVNNPVRNPSFEVGNDGWTALFRKREYANAAKESGNNAPSPDNAVLNIINDVASPQGKKYLSLTVNPACRANVTSAYFPARYGHPLSLRFSARSDSSRSFSAGIGGGKDNSIRYVSSARTATTSWQQFTLPFTLQPTQDGKYYVFFQFETKGRFDIDAVSVVEQAQTSPVYYPPAMAVLPDTGAPVGNMYAPGTNASFTLQVAGVASGAAQNYRLTTVNYLDQVIADTTIAITGDASGYGIRSFYSPLSAQGAFKINARHADSILATAEQIYTVLPVLPAPSTRPDSYFGGHADLTPYNLEIARKGGFRCLRLYPPLTTHWMVNEPAPGVWVFDTTAIATAYHQGFSLLSTFNTAPDAEADLGGASATLNRWSSAYPPASINAWKNYVKKCYLAFSPYIKNWEVWNEPDGNYLQVKAGVTKDSVYHALLKGARQILDSLHAPDPLIGPALASMANPLGVAILNRGGDSLMDAYSFHFYNMTGGGNNPDNVNIQPVINQIRTYRNNAGQVMPIWITEGGVNLGRSWLTTYNVPSSSSVSVPQAAAAKVRAALYFKALGVKRYFDYDLFASASGRNIFIGGTSGMTDVNGIPGPALAAHAAMVAIAEDATPLGFEVLTGTDVKVTHFMRGTDSLDVYWSGTAHALSGVASLQPGDVVMELMGNVIDATTAQTGEYPLYVLRNQGSLLKQAPSLNKKNGK